MSQEASRFAPTGNSRCDCSRLEQQLPGVIFLRLHRLAVAILSRRLLDFEQQLLTKALPTRKLRV
jgi:hypothetical protein